MNHFLEAALEYASMGWCVFPLAPGQKIPITAHGVKDATTNEKQIREWWNKWPNANIGLACGAQSGVYVIDVDISASGDVNGLESLKEFPELPQTVCQHTPRGGFHAFYQTLNPPANRNSFRPGIDIRGDGYYVVVTPSIHPNGGQYVWAKKCAPGKAQLAEYPDFMRPTVRPPWASQQPLSPPVMEVRHYRPANDETLHRASLWLTEADPAVQGQGGHDRLFWAAQGMVNGCGLSDEQAFDILAREYNPRCIPPWDLSNQKDFKDFRRKISEARKNPPSDKSALWIINDPLYINKSIAELSKEVDVNSLLSEAYPETKTRKIILPDDELSFLCHPTGLLGDICSWINSTAIKEQPFLSIGCTLAFLGALFGRKVKDKLGSRTNLYCIGVAASSAGKAHAPNQLRRLAEMSGSIHLIGGDDIASDTSIEERLSWEPSTIFFWDEIGHLLAHIKSGMSKHHARVVSLLMRLYSAAGNVYKGREYAEIGKQRTIVQPCCCIYGSSTPERFVTGISSDELHDGWLSRCLVFYSDNDPQKTRGIAEKDVPKNIIEIVHAWVERQIKEPTDGKNINQFVTQYGDKQPPKQIIVPSTPEAESHFIEFDKISHEYGMEWPTLSGLWSKAEENARRIALIISCGEQFESPVITDSVADYATRLIQYILVYFSKIFEPQISSSPIEAQKRKIYGIVKEYGVNGCEKRILTRRTQWANNIQRTGLVKDLIEAEELVCELKEEQNNKNRIHYWTAENYILYKRKFEQ